MADSALLIDLQPIQHTIHLTIRQAGDYQYSGPFNYKPFSKSINYNHSYYLRVKRKMEKLFIFHKNCQKQPKPQGSIQEIELEFSKRKEHRQQRLSDIKNQMEELVKGRERKKQNVFLFLLNLAIPLVMSCIVAYIFIDYEVQIELKGILIACFTFGGLLAAIISNLMLAPWKQVLKLYLLVDSLAPVLIATIISFYCILNFLSVGAWYNYVYATAFPAWVIYFAGNLRVMVAYSKCSRWQIIIFKLALLICGLVFFYVGYTFMKGGYKITRGYLIEVESRFRDMTYLYVFGVVQLCFEYYRRLSYFDQTEELKYEYQFKDQSEIQKKLIAQEEYKRMQLQVLCEELKEQLIFGCKRQSRLSSFSSNMSHSGNGHEVN